MIIKVQDNFIYLDISYIKVYINHTITKSFPWNSCTNNIPLAISSTTYVAIISCRIKHTWQSCFMQ